MPRIRITRTRIEQIRRPRRLAAFVTTGLVGAISALGAFVPAHAASATFGAYRTYYSPASQGATTGSYVTWVNRDSVAHHIVGWSRTSSWSFDAVVQPGQAVSHVFGSVGSYAFRDADHSTLARNSYGNVTCSGACGAVAVRNA
jgi:plastocyanin